MRPQMAFERLVQARQAGVKHIPPRSCVVGAVLGGAFTHGGRAALLLLISPFAADKRLATRTLNLGSPQSGVCV